MSPWLLSMGYRMHGASKALQEQRNGSKAIRWTANASVPVPLTVKGSRSASPRDLVAFVRPKEGFHEQAAQRHV